FGPLIERVSLRVEDINGPRGGVDTVCRIQPTVSGRRGIVVEGRGSNPKKALADAGASIARALERSVDRAAPRAREPAVSSRRPHRRGMVYVLEESATGRPPRKSTRKSANRKKGASQLSRSVARRKHTPKVRARRAQQTRSASRRSSKSQQ